MIKTSYNGMQGLSFHNLFNHVCRTFRQSAWPLLTPIALLYGFVLIYPLLWLLYRSFIGDDGATIKNYVEIFATPVFFSVLWHSFVVGIIVTISCIVLGYPLAYLITFVKPRTRLILIGTLLTPLLVGALIRSFAWLAILAKQGVVNETLLRLGVINSPLQLVYNSAGLYIGMINVMLPFCVLPMVSVMRSIDGRLINAAQSLGARPFSAFIRIFLPLSMTGVTAGGMLTFLLSIGFYITPALLGGRQETMIAQLIQTEVMNLGAFGMAAAMGWVLMAFTLLVLAIYHYFFDLNQLFGGKP